MVETEAMCVFATAAGTLVGEDVESLIREVSSVHLRQLMEDMSAQSGLIEQWLGKSGEKDSQQVIVSLISDKDVLTLGETMAKRVLLVNRYKIAMHAGLLRVFAFLFSLERFRVAWNGLLSKIQQ